MSPTYYVHPEFGYFCPGPRARRELRVAVVSILFGMVIGAAIVTVHAGHVVEIGGVSSNAQLKSSSSDPLLPGGNGPTAQSMTAGNDQTNSAETIKPYPMRRVRVPTKASGLAGIAPAQSEPPPSAGPTSHENEQAALSPAASPEAQKSRQLPQFAIPTTRRRPSAIYARRPQDDQNENARWQSWGKRAYTEDRYWRGASRTWVHW